MVILVTSIGSISASFVIKTLKLQNFNVIGIDMYPQKWIANSTMVDKFFQVPTVDNYEYEKKVKEICEKMKVDLILPLTDVDVDYFECRRNIYEEKNIKITISSSEEIRKMRNKLKLFQIYKNSKINVIPTYTYRDYDIECNIYPCISKPAEGRSSEGKVIIKNKLERERYFLENERVYQPFISGDVYVVDMIKNQHNEIYFVVRKELTRTTNGAGIAVEIIRPNELLISTLEEFAKKINFLGCINIEFICNNNKYYLMDVNPRPSAGIIYSYMAGYNFITAHVFTFINKEIKKLKKLRYGEIYTRKFKEVQIKS